MPIDPKQMHLTEEERMALQSMARYWTEVAGREDTSPLRYEVQQLREMLGTRLLWIVRDYVEGVGYKTAEQEKEK